MFDFYSGRSVKSDLSEALDEIKEKIDKLEENNSALSSELNTFKEHSETILIGFFKVKDMIEKLKNLYNKPIEPKELSEHLDKIESLINELYQYADDLYCSDEIHTISSLL